MDYLAGTTLHVARRITWPVWATVVAALVIVTLAALAAGLLGTDIAAVPVAPVRW